MFKRSFGSLPKEKEVTKDLPLVGSLSFKDFFADKTDVEVTPITCKNCGVVLMDFSVINFKGTTGKYVCEFCGTVNEVSREEINTVVEQVPSSEGREPEEYGAIDLCFILEAIRKEKGPTEEKKPFEGDLLIAAIDISGSMAGGKIEAVRKALVENIRDFKMNSPDQAFVLVTFESNLQLFLRPDKMLQIPDGDVMHSEKLLENQVTDFTKKLKPISIGEIGDKWIKIVQGLQSADMTALGPATFVCLALTKVLPTNAAKVILLTDGLANVGIGRIENEPQPKAKEFYANLGQQFQARGVIVQVLGVRDPDAGNNVALDIVGILTEITGGDMVFIESSEIAKFMGEASRKRFVARNTIIRVFTPPEIEIDGITGTYVQGPIPRAPGQPISLGSISDDREIYLKFKSKQHLETEKVPIQIQMEYLDEDNRKCVRVIKQEVETADDTTFKEQFNPTLVSNMVIQDANEAYQKADVKQAKQKVSAYMGTLQHMAQGGAGAPAPMMDEAVNLLKDELEEWKESEQEMQEKNVTDQKSFFASKAQSLKRMSVDDRTKRMKARKST